MGGGEWWSFDCVRVSWPWRPPTRYSHTAVAPPNKILAHGMRSLVFSAAAAVAAASASAGDAWNLRLLDLAAAPMAQCLDGTAGGYWAFNGTGADASKWIIHLQGGGWCVNEEDCVGRSKTALGSSTSWSSEPEPTADGGVAGLFNSDGGINPYYANWTKMCVSAVHPRCASASPLLHSRAAHATAMLAASLATVTARGA